MTYAEIINGMARAFFACAWAEQAEECGQTLRGEILEQIPSTFDPAAIQAAHTLAMDMEWVNGQPLAEIYAAHTGDLTPCLWGHYAAMQSLGHGVGLWEYIEEGVKVPHVEFGSYSLERDYFTAEVDQ